MQVFLRKNTRIDQIGLQVVLVNRAGLDTDAQRRQLLGRVNGAEV